MRTKLKTFSEGISTGGNKIHLFRLPEIISRKKQRKRPPPKAWHLIPKDQRLGDIRETILNLEPRKSDPFPRPVVRAMKRLHARGFSYENIDRAIRNLIMQNRLPAWMMHISDFGEANKNPRIPTGENFHSSVGWY